MSMRFLRFRWYLLVFLIIAAVATAAITIVNLRNPVKGPLTGHVGAVKGKLPFGLPGIVGVKVVAEPGGQTARADLKGRFALRVQPGVYELQFSARGYESRRLRVLVPAAAPATVDTALFPIPQGPPVAVLRLGTESASAAKFPYRRPIYLDISSSKNISSKGIRWEILDPSGRVLNDPYALPTRPLQLEPSPIPGSSPLSFTFTPPYPGRFKVRLILTNDAAPGRSSTTEIRCTASNAYPEALPSVIGGVTDVQVGERVRLAGWGLDGNVPSPELYNPGGRKPDAYGKNDDRLQRQFGWTWRLDRMDSNGRGFIANDLLRSDEPGEPRHAQCPSFVPGVPGKYLATLVVSDRDPYGNLDSAAKTVTVTVRPKAEGLVADETCTKEGCHDTIKGRGVQGQAKLGGMTCQTCHGPGRAHVAAKDPAEKRATITVSYSAEQCGRCHVQYAEWGKSRHADGYPFGYYEIAQPLLLNCAKCHYPQGFGDAMVTAQAKKTSFGAVEFKKPLYPGGPPFFDFDKLPPRQGDGVSCQACHDPHLMSAANRMGLRSQTPAQLCGTCHEEKWQNVLLERTAGRVSSAFEYPGENYQVDNPHDTKDKCLLCHMTTSAKLTDGKGVRALGGHTLRMRDAGPDGRLGGFGPSPDDPARPRELAGADDTLNIGACRKCHPGATSFDIDGRQGEIYRLWQELGGLLKERNHGVLPGYKPGDKCATCHRGGTLPFDNDPHLVLENAYTNYKLVMNDRSWGIHNYKYTKKLLEDSIKSVKAVPIGK